MPNVPTYVRKEDYGKYVAIQSQAGAWAEFIHNALNETTDEYVAKKIKDAIKPIKTSAFADFEGALIANPKQLKKFGANEVIKSPRDAEKAVTKLPTLIEDGLHPIVKLCKIHGTPLDDRGFCLVKGCKYGPK